MDLVDKASETLWMMVRGGRELSKLRSVVSQAQSASFIWPDGFLESVGVVTPGLRTVTSKEERLASGAVKETQQLHALVSIVRLHCRHSCSARQANANTK